MTDAAEAGRPPTGVLLMAYGTPATPADIEAYYTHVRRGRPPAPAQLDELRGRYEAIGGTSPLLERTQEQRAGIAAALGDGFRVELGMKHAPPFLEDGVAALASAGVAGIVGLVLAPHYSALSVGEYATRAAAAADEAGLVLRMVESWHLSPGYLDLLAGFVQDAVAGLGVDPVEVVFTAHSLPERILALGDPYPDQLAETAKAVAERAGISRWSVGWQSAGRTPEPWIGPDLLSVLPMLVGAGAAGAVVCACGFVSDHLEVLYDLDVEARAEAARLGLAFARTPSPNARPEFCAAVAQVIRDVDLDADAGGHA
ncbi:MAG TPA: ferrochelatase [Acidimicrobiales bacterium]|nr:ferrochelatase [Acidimicrobiales bacterium]